MNLTKLRRGGYLAAGAVAVALLGLPGGASAAGDTCNLKASAKSSSQVACPDGTFSGIGRKH